MTRVPLGEQAQNKSLSIKPIKMLEVFENDVKEALDLNLSESVSSLILYFIKNKNNKKLLKELEQIRREIDTRNVSVKPSF